MVLTCIHRADVELNPKQRPVAPPTLASRKGDLLRSVLQFSIRALLRMDEVLCSVHASSVNMHLPKKG